MNRILLIVIVYALVSTVVVASLADVSPGSLMAIPATAPRVIAGFALGSWPGLAAVLAWIALTQSGTIHARLRRVFPMLLACGLMFSAFTFTKNHLSAIVPFYADQALADLDAALHLGHDPWVLTHRLESDLLSTVAGWAYQDFWLVPAMFLPAILPLVDADEGRIIRFCQLYLVTWIFLGNILALTVMSAGPVYYDRLLGTDRFAGLDAGLAGLGLPGVINLQNFLWANYQSGNLVSGAGISAFPSVHIGMVTVWALYIAERFPRLLPLSVLLVAAYTFFSVYLGWHYAIDGYASTLILVLCWHLLRRRAAGRAAG